VAPGGEYSASQEGLRDCSLVHEVLTQSGNGNCLKELITVYNIDPMGIGANDDDFG
jgi:hypothetical protein